MSVALLEGFIHCTGPPGVVLVEQRRCRALLKTSISDAEVDGADLEIAFSPSSAAAMTSLSLMSDTSSW